MRPAEDGVHTSGTLLDRTGNELKFCTQHCLSGRPVNLKFAAPEALSKLYHLSNRRRSAGVRKARTAALDARGRVRQFS